MSVTVRGFERSDRDQLTALINLHVAAVIPGVALSVNTVLSQLEREPGEVIVDPWVRDRECLVAFCGDALVAVALLHRFADRDEIPAWCRGAGDVRWLVYLPNSMVAAAELLTGCFRRFDEWQSTHVYADGALPAIGCYGVPNVWPHIRRLYSEAGFVPSHDELVLVARCENLIGQAVDEAEIVRTMGHLGARLTLLRDGLEMGFIEVGEISADSTRSYSSTSWTDVGNLHVTEQGDRRPIMAALLSSAADWLRLGGVDRLVEYFRPDQEDPETLRILHELGFEDLVHIERGWKLNRS